jgi:uncharacterized protein (TIGR03435 family)
MERIRAKALVAVVLAAGAFAQSFEVASVKPHPEDPHIIGISTSGPRLKAEAETLAGLILYAYQIRNYQLIRTPQFEAAGDGRYDVEAKAEGEGAPSKPEFRQLLQALLAERFHLAVHREMRETPVYALVVGKNGPKFKAGAPDAKPSGTIRMKSKVEVSLTNEPMDSVVDAIENSFLDRPVVDRTGLTGGYDVKLTYSQESRIRGAEPAVDRINFDGINIDDINIFTAVQEQLGLKLEPQKASVEVLVVDHAEKPSGN